MRRRFSSVLAVMLAFPTTLQPPSHQDSIAVRVDIGDQTSASWDGFGTPVLRVSARGNRNAIVGLADNNLSPGSLSFPTGVSGYGRISSGSSGNVAFGFFGKCNQYAAGVCTNELNSFNYFAPPDTALPPNRGFGTTHAMPITLTLGAGGAYQSAIALHIAREGSLPSRYTNGIYVDPDAVTGTALIIDASSTDGPVNGAVIKHVGLGTNLILTTVGAPVLGNNVLTIRREDNNLQYAGITQSGSMLIGPGASDRGAGPASCSAGGPAKTEGDS